MYQLEEKPECVVAKSFTDIFRITKFLSYENIRGKLFFIDFIRQFFGIKSFWFYLFFLLAVIYRP